MYYIMYKLTLNTVLYSVSHLLTCYYGLRRGPDPNGNVRSHTAVGVNTVFNTYAEDPTRVS
jgi:hypothetical protein